MGIEKEDDKLNIYLRNELKEDDESQRNEHFIEYSCFIGFVVKLRVSRKRCCKNDGDDDYRLCGLTQNTFLPESLLPDVDLLWSILETENVDVGDKECTNTTSTVLAEESEVRKPGCIPGIYCKLVMKNWRREEKAESRQTLNVIRHGQLVCGRTGRKRGMLTRNH